MVFKKGVSASPSTQFNAVNGNKPGPKKGSKSLFKALSRKLDEKMPLKLCRKYDIPEGVTYYEAFVTRVAEQIVDLDPVFLQHWREGMLSPSAGDDSESRNGRMAIIVHKGMKIVPKMPNEEEIAEAEFEEKEGE